MKSIVTAPELENTATSGQLKITSSRQTAFHRYLPRMRALALICLIGSPATAWEFSPTPVCIVSNGDRDVSVTVAFDPATSIYAIHLTLDAAWPDGPVFGISFEGPNGLTISTTRHTISPDGHTLTVTDSGFGNVLNGLQFNDRATAVIADQSFSFDLTGAEEPVAQFRDCGDPLTS